MNYAIIFFNVFLLLFLINFLFAGIAIQSSLSEEQTKIHSALLSQLAAKASSFVETLDQSDELTFLRIRSKNREVMVC